MGAYTVLYSTTTTVLEARALLTIYTQTLLVDLAYICMYIPCYSGF